MRYLVIRYTYAEPNSEPEIAQTWNFDDFLDGIDFLAERVGRHNLYDAMQYSFSELVYKMTDHEGFAIATELEVDPTDG